MALPLLTNDYFEQPKYSGAISPFVAQAMIQAGRALSERVDQQYAVSQAQALAPSIQKEIAQGYQQIGSGDMSGFTRIQSASLKGIGNPFLMSAADDALKVGTKLADHYWQSKLLDERLAAKPAGLTLEDRVALIEAKNKGALDVAGVRANASRDIAATGADARVESAQIGADARVDSAQIGADVKQGALEQKSEDAEAERQRFEQRKSEMGIGPQTDTPSGQPSVQVTPPSQTQTQAAPQNGGVDYVNWIKGLEGFSAKPYGDNKQTSIGYGTVARPGDREITPAEAETRLQEELKQHESRVDSAAKQYGYSLNPQQRAALISFDYNTGAADAVMKTAGGDITKVAAKLPEYNKETKGGEKVFSPGLANRRAKELAMLTGRSLVNESAAQKPAIVFDQDKDGEWKWDVSTTQTVSEKGGETISRTVKESAESKKVREAARANAEKAVSALSKIDLQAGLGEWIAEQGANGRVPAIDTAGIDQKKEKGRGRFLVKVPSTAENPEGNAYFTDKSGNPVRVEPDAIKGYKELQESLGALGKDFRTMFPQVEKKKQEIAKSSIDPLASAKGMGRNIQGIESRRAQIVSVIGEQRFVDIKNLNVSKEKKAQLILDAMAEALFKQKQKPPAPVVGTPLPGVVRAY